MPDDAGGLPERLPSGWGKRGVPIVLGVAALVAALVLAWSQLGGGERSPATQSGVSTSSPVTSAVTSSSTPAEPATTSSSSAPPATSSPLSSLPLADPPSQVDVAKGGGSGEARISWQAVTDTSVTSYRLYFVQASGDLVLVKVVPNDDSPEFPPGVRGFYDAPPVSMPCYRVSSVNAAGEGAASQPSCGYSQQN